MAVNGGDCNVYALFAVNAPIIRMVVNIGCIYTSQIPTLQIFQGLKALATIPYLNFHFFPHLLIFLQFRDPSYVLNLSTKAVLQKWHI